jgi:hypothetical protein|tara:strand:- start:109 stop:297 length:189 start_codon:yes stop_codon:yes gene_type:complete
MGCLFLLLSFITVAAAIVAVQVAAAIPFLVFFIIGSVCILSVFWVASEQSLKLGVVNNHCDC